MQRWKKTRESWRQGALARCGHSVTTFFFLFLFLARILSSCSLQKRIKKKKKREKSLKDLEREESRERGETASCETGLRFYNWPSTQYNERETWERHGTHSLTNSQRKQPKYTQQMAAATAGCCLLFFLFFSLQTSFIKRPLPKNPPSYQKGPLSLSVEHPKGFYYLCESCDVACWIHYDFHFTSSCCLVGGLLFGLAGYISFVLENTAWHSRRARYFSLSTPAVVSISCVCFLSLSLPNLFGKSSLRLVRCLSLMHSKVIK